MNEYKYTEIKQFDKEHGTDFIAQIELVCADHATAKLAHGVFCQLRTDWTLQGVTYALRQTLRYIGYGYDDPMIFKNLGAVVSRIFSEMDSAMNSAGDVSTN